MLIKPILIYYKLFYAAGHYFGWILKVESERLYCQILSTGIYWIVRWSRRPEIITALTRNWQQKGQLTNKCTAVDKKSSYFVTATTVSFAFLRTNLQKENGVKKLFLWRRWVQSDDGLVKDQTFDTPPLICLGHDEFI